ncbi:uncharacterized protein LOC144544746 isoform X2 [Carex rostrata]
MWCRQAAPFQVQRIHGPSHLPSLPRAQIDEYLKGCRFLPKLNNEKAEERNSTYKERFSSLENLLKNDLVLIPKETTWFGFYPDGSFNDVLSPQEIPVVMNLAAPKELREHTYVANVHRMQRDTYFG